MRLYDIVILLIPDLSEEEAAKVTADYRKILTDGGAELVRDESWGRRKLAYPIGRKRDAYYHHFQVRAEAPAIAETERRLKLSDQVVRHLAVRADEELKRAAKMAERLRVKAVRRPPRPASVATGDAAPAPRSEEAPVQERSE